MAEACRQKGNRPQTSPEAVLGQLDVFPMLPPVAARLLQANTDSEIGARDIVALLSADPSLAARILAMAGSTSAGGAAAHSLDRAVSLLGVSAVRSVVLAAALFECFVPWKTNAEPRAFDRREFWKHALAVACTARGLAKLRPELRVEPEDAFAAGLLHDVGKAALDAVFPKAYERIASEALHQRGDISDLERSVLGADHTRAGRRLAEHWKLPRRYREAIWLHHLASDALPASVAAPALIGVVQLADTIAREQRIGLSGNFLFYEHSPRGAERLGFTEAQIDVAVAPLVREVADCAARLGLDRETPEAIYFKAMTSANAEIGHLSSGLSVSNVRLAAAARYFKALGEFDRTLTAWADPFAVVVAATRAAAVGLQRPRLVLLGFRPQTEGVHVALLDSGELRATSREWSDEMRAWFAEYDAPSDAFPRRAPGAVLTLLADEMTAAQGEAVWLIPIGHANRLVGAILFAAHADECARFTDEMDELRAFVTSIGLAFGRAHAQSAANRLSEDLAESNRRLQQMQVEILRSRTLSMIAEMAAGAGHELNSPLTVISGRAQMLAQQTENPEFKRALRQIQEKAHECSRIVTELMDFAKPRPPRPTRVNLVELLSLARAEFLSRKDLPPLHLILEAARLGPAIDPDSGLQSAPISADADQVRQTVLELLENAADAVMPRGGTIRIACEPADDGDAYEIRVIDDGCGMSPAVQERAFDPFFSHRRAGRGRGLGLARAHRIVEAHGGRIWIESRVGEGTVVHVVIPRTAAEL